MEAAPVAHRGFYSAVFSARISIDLGGLLVGPAVRPVEPYIGSFLKPTHDQMMKSTQKIPRGTLAWKSHNTLMISPTLSSLSKVIVGGPTCHSFYLG